MKSLIKLEGDEHVRDSDTISITVNGSGVSIYRMIYCLLASLAKQYDMDVATVIRDIFHVSTNDIPGIDYPDSPPEGLSFPGSETSH